MRTILGLPSPIFMTILVSTAIAAAPAFIAAWLLPIARTRSRRRRNACVSCGHSMEALDTCPECGRAREARSRSNTVNVRLATAGLLLGLLAMHLWWWALREARGEQATRFIPTTVLVCCADVEPDAAMSGLKRAAAMRSGQMWDWQEYIGTWRELRHAEKWLARQSIQCRSVWPARSIPVVTTNFRNFDNLTFMRGRMLARRAGDSQWQWGSSFGPPILYQAPFSCGMSSGPEYPWAAELPGSIPGSNSLKIELRLEPEHGPAIEKIVDLEYVVATPEQGVLQPVQNPQIGAAIMEAMRVVGSGRLQKRNIAGMLLYPDESQLYMAMKPMGLDESVLAYECTLSIGDTIIAEGAYQFDPTFSFHTLRLTYRTPDYETLLTRPDNRDTLAQITVHLTGSEVRSARNPRATWYWSGEVTAKYSDLAVYTGPE